MDINTNEDAIKAQRDAINAEWDATEAEYKRQMASLELSYREKVRGFIDSLAELDSKLGIVETHDTGVVQK